MRKRAFRESLLDTERVSMADKQLGILSAGSSETDVQVVSTVIRNLSAAGCLEQNIKIRKVPSTADIPIGVLFFAEYTDVDAVIVLSYEESLPDYIHSSVTDLQIQWNMPVIIGNPHNYNSVHNNAADILSLQESMEIESEATAHPDRKTIN